MATGLSKTKWQGTLLPHEETQANDITLTYPQKNMVTDVLQLSPATVQPLWQGSSSAINRLYYGDNLPVLAHLYQTPTVAEKIKLIYIDPPFATKQIFQSRAQSDAYQDLRGGADYIEFLRQRLIFLRELLAEDGSIYIHLDMNMAFHIKLIMDELFGPNNFRNWITRKKCNPKNFTRKSYGNISDYILFYTKSNNYTWNRPYIPWTPEKTMKEYQYIEPETGRRYKKVPVHAPGERNGETGKPWRGKLPPPGKHWQYTPQVLDEMDARGEIYWSPTGNPRRKIYLDESPGIAVQDIWLDSKDAHNQNIKITGYPTEKNPSLLNRIINTSSNPGDIVLDCFAGSGTTLDVAHSLNRHWIGIDNGVEAITTILKRFSIGLEPMGDFINADKQSTNSQLTFFDTYTNNFPDFTLYGTETYQEELDSVLKQWGKTA